MNRTKMRKGIRFESENRMPLEVALGRVEDVKGRNLRDN